MSEWQPFEVSGVRASVTAVTLSRRGSDTPPMTVELIDEGAGGYLSISDGEGHIQMDPEEWPALREVIERLLPMCAPAPKGDR